MNTAQEMALLNMLKVDLGIRSTESYDNRLTQIIKAAAEFITREGATLNYNSAEDLQLIVMYAAWIWRKRDTGDGMPRILRWALNNRILSEKMRTN